MGRVNHEGDQIQASGGHPFSSQRRRTNANTTDWCPRSQRDRGELLDRFFLVRHRMQAVDGRRNIGAQTNWYGDFALNVLITHYEFKGG